MKVYILFILLSISSLIVSASAQPNSCIDKLTSFMQNMESYHALFPQEKVWLHFDNTGYIEGDTIWFKAYIASASSLLPTEHSKVLYVELLSDQGEVLISKKLKIENGQCHGEIPLKRETLFSETNYMPFEVNPRTKRLIQNYPPGYYEVRAYTQAMLNWGVDVVFSRIFPVFDKHESGRELTYTMLGKDVGHTQRELFNLDDSLSLDVSFYPEGGYLVRGLQSNVSVKVVDGLGRNMMAEGRVFDETNSEVTSFRVIHDGMGVFTLTPLSKRYYAEVQHHGKSYRFDLPLPEESGCVLAVNNHHDDYLYVDIHKSPDTLSVPLGVSITCQGRVCLFDTLSARFSHQQLIIPKERLMAGVNQLTLFDTEGKVYADRLFFHKDEGHRTEVSVQYDSAACTPLKRIEMKIQTGIRNEAGRSISVSIRDGALLPATSYRDDLYTYMLLSSDVKGFVYNPHYYFEDNDRKRTAALDLLMLTQGWRRYEWTKAATPSLADMPYAVEKELSIKGRMLSEKGLKPLEKILVQLCGQQGRVSNVYATSLTDSAGRFSFHDDDFYGTRSFELVAISDKKQKPRIVWDNYDLSPTYGFRASYTDCLIAKPKPKNSLGLMQDQSPLSEVQQLDEILVSAKRRKPQPFTILNVDRDRNRMLNERKFPPETVFDYLKERYPDIHLVGGANLYMGDVRCTAATLVYGMWSKKRPLHKYAHETRLENVREIFFYENLDAYKYLTFTKEGQGRVPVKGYLFALVPYSGYEADYKRHNRRRVELKGYAKPVEFYNPQYAHRKPSDEVDTRRTLYWNPNLELDEDGNAEVSFYNNSSCKELDVDVQVGIVGEGRDEKKRKVVSCSR